MLACVAFFVWAIVRADRKGDEKLPIIAEIYNSGTGELTAYVYATNGQHRLENGKIEEVWLVRVVAGRDPSPPIWTVKPKKNARVVWR
jgi:hypothetical protein